VGVWMDIKIPEKTLVPRKVLKVKGSLSYNDNRGAWSIIRMKNDILEEFYQLKEKRSKFGYEMIYPRSIEELEEIFKKIKKDGGGMPVLLFFVRDDN